MIMSRLSCMSVFMRTAVLLYCAVVSFASCNYEVCDEVAAKDSVEICFSVEDNVPMCKSSLAVAESKVIDLTILTYCDGTLVRESYYETFSSMAMILERDKEYDFYALANMGRINPPVLEKDVRSFAFSMSYAGNAGRGFPMCWSMTRYRPSTADEVSIALTRLVAKVVVSVDPGTTGLKVASVSVLQAPVKVRPFSESGSKALSGEASVGDYASESDIMALNSGGTASFYMLENMQGTLLKGNTDSMQKIPPASSEQFHTCTYIEVQCAFVDCDDKEGDVCYRMFLGEDALSNFDVARNKIISLVLKLTDDGFKVSGSWKVTADYIQHVTDVAIEADVMKMNIGETKVLTASVLPSDAEDRSVSWYSSNAKVATVNVSGVVTAVGEGTCVIKAVSNDMKECSDQCTVTVADAVSGLYFTPSSVSAVLGYEGQTRTSDFSVTATYVSGKIQRVTDVCDYKYDSSSVSIDVPGVVTHKTAGSAVVTASYQGKTAKLDVATHGFAVAGVEFENDSYVVSLGESPTIRYRVIYNDGTCSDYTGYQLANFKGGSCMEMVTGDAGIAYVNTYGRLTTCSVGKTTLKVSVWSSADQTAYAAEAQLTVNEAYLVSVYASMPPMFYHQSGGPALVGVYSDGTERILNVSWTTSNQYVSYTESGGIVVSDESRLSTGVTLVTFTGAYDGKSASVTAKYGKWIRGAKLEKTLAGAGLYRYRMIIVYDDFTESYVPFAYQTSTDCVSWTSSATASASGITVTATMPETVLRAVTIDRFYDSEGNHVTWSVGH